MNTERIKELAKDYLVYEHFRQYEFYSDELEQFAKLIAAEEREACAKLCDAIDAEYEGEDVLATWCAEAIRARGNK
jgi:hypothetical protein